MIAFVAFAKLTGEFIKRFWPAILAALVVAWIAGVVIERNSLRDQVASMKVDLKGSSHKENQPQKHLHIK